MNKETIKQAFADANELADGLPQHLQEKAFELAVGILVAGIPAAPKTAVKHEPAHTPQRKHAQTDVEHPAVSDLLKVCGRNPDKFVVFLHELEERGESATPDALTQLFKDYKQDPPGNMPRDLKGLAAKDYAKQSGKEYGTPWELRSKGRQRYQQLIAALNGE